MTIYYVKIPTGTVTTANINQLLTDEMNDLAKRHNEVVVSSSFVNVAGVMCQEFTVHSSDVDRQVRNCINGEYRIEAIVEPIKGRPIDKGDIDKFIKGLVPMSMHTALAPSQPLGHDVPAPAVSPETDLPAFGKSESYASVRAKMLMASWKPVHAKDADSCGESDARCKDRPEMVSCAGSGEANCKFLWSKQDKVVALCTVGEDAALAGICSL